MHQYANIHNSKVVTWVFLMWRLFSHYIFQGMFSDWHLLGMFFTTCCAISHCDHLGEEGVACSAFLWIVTCVCLSFLLVSLVGLALRLWHFTDSVFIILIYGVYSFPVISCLIFMFGGPSLALWSPRCGRGSWLCLVDPLWHSDHLVVEEGAGCVWWTLSGTLITSLWKRELAVFGGLSLALWSPRCGRGSWLCLVDPLWHSDYLVVEEGAGCVWWTLSGTLITSLWKRELAVFGGPSLALWSPRCGRGSWLCLVDLSGTLITSVVKEGAGCVCGPSLALWSPRCERGSWLCLVDHLWHSDHLVVKEGAGCFASLCFALVSACCDWPPPSQHST